MRHWNIAVAVVAAMGLCGCDKSAEGTLGGSNRHDRYLGVGVYPAGQMWSRMVVANAPKDAASAKTNDDEQVIVVIDSKTGELRECGNLTGYCVGMNPWTNPLTTTQHAPIRLTKHTDDPQQDAAADSAKR